jgi:serine/threonine protein kinase
MDIYCTRPNCPKPRNSLYSLTHTILKAAPLQFCRACAMPLLLNGRYLPIKRLKVGACDTTFLAEDIYAEPEQQFIVTQLRTDIDLSHRQVAEIKEKFKQEAKNLEIFGAGHRQIPSLYAYFELDALVFSESQLLSHATEQFFYVVQEYIEGQTLAQELRQKGRFSEPRVINVMRQILPILQFIHGHGRTHQNITPETIVRDRVGRLYLTDFGILKQAIAVSPQSLIQSSKFSSIGTASLFAPPEQQLGRQVYPSSDLYSLAVTMLFLFTNQDLQTLFDSDSQQWHWQTNAQMSDRLHHILDTMLQPLPQQRFQSSAEVMAALSRQALAMKEYSNGFNQVAGVEAKKELQSKSLIVLPQPELAQSQAEITQAEIHTSKPDVQPIASEPEAQPVSSEADFGNSFKATNSQPEDNVIEEPLELIRQATILGSGSWLFAIALISFVGTLIASGIWLVILTGVIFGILAREQSFVDKARLLLIAIASVGAMYFLAPQFFRIFDFAKALPQLLLMTVAAGLLALILIMLSQLIYDSFSQN